MVNRVCLYITSSLCFCLSDGVPCFCRNQTSKGSSNRKTTCSSALHWVLPSVNAHTHTHKQTDRQEERGRHIEGIQTERQSGYVTDPQRKRKDASTASFTYKAGHCTSVVRINTCTHACHLTNTNATTSMYAGKNHYIITDMTCGHTIAESFSILDTVKATNCQLSVYSTGNVHTMSI